MKWLLVILCFGGIAAALMIANAQMLTDPTIPNALLPLKGSELLYIVQNQKSAKLQVSALIAGPFRNVVGDCNAVGNDVVDDAPAIQSCINGLPAQGGIIFFPANYTFKTTSTLTIGNGSSSAGSTTTGVILIGGGNPTGIAQFGPNVFGGPTIDYQGSGDAVQIAGPLLGWGVQNLHINCSNSVGTTGLHVISASYGDNRNFRISGCATGINSASVEIFGGYSTTDSAHNDYKHFAVELTGLNSTGIVIQGSGSSSPTSDTDFSVFDDWTIYFTPSISGNGYGVVIRVADDNKFSNGHFTAKGTPAATAIFPFLLDYTVNNIWPSNNIIDTVDPGQLGCGGTVNGCGFDDSGDGIHHNFTNVGTPGLFGNASAEGNFLKNLELGNGATYPMDLPNLYVDHLSNNWNGAVPGPPTLTGSGNGAQPATYLVQKGWVTESGYEVTVHFNVGTSSVAGMTGNLLLTNLPAQVGAESLSNESMICPIAANGVNFSSGRSMAYISAQQGLHQAAVGETGGGSNAGPMPLSDVSVGGITLFGSCTYHRGR